MAKKKKEEKKEKEEESDVQEESQDLQHVIQVSGLYKDWFLDYASYVILERAVPHIHDGLKPVQRRILHSLKEIDDGRFHKVANVIGNTMKYHPHGDASIGDALVQIGQKELLLDMQGNWGNIFTGDRAAAARYIETRLSKFALEVAFNAKTTEWLASYDGRGKEPVTLPMKFPLLLAQGAEGIAVGLACKILPHNFNELIDGSIKILKGKTPKILPDFPTGGMADFSGYNDGLRGGKIKVRARIKQEDKKTLLITEIPFGTTTNSLIDSIIRANEKGKIKIKKIEDNTAEHVEVAIHLAPNTSPDKTIDALYAFTDCEVSISPNACVIENDKPRFVGVQDMLKISTERTVDLLKQELEIKLGELQEQWHFSSLEKIFIEKRIYRDIEECETWEAIIKTIHKGLKPHIKHLLREVTDEDVARLTEIRIKRISKFDSFKADEFINKLEDEIEQVKHDLKHLTDYAIYYFTRLKEKYGKGRERKTEIKTFDTIDATKVAVANVKLYVNRQEGFVGYGLRKDEFVEDCSDIDDIIVFRSDGKYSVTKIADKTFVGKDIIHVGVWKRGDDRMVYHAVYVDAKSKKSFVKRFCVTSITRDKDYDLTKGSAGSKVHYFTANPNAESEVISIVLTPGCKAKKKVFDFDFADLAIKGRGSGGNALTRWPVKKVERKSGGHSTLGGIDIWFDDTVGRLNMDERGKYLGNFADDDRILVIYNEGTFELTNYEITNRYESTEIEVIEKLIPEKPISVVYYDGDKKNYFVKRFLIEVTTVGQKYSMIGEHKDSKQLIVATGKNAVVEVNSLRGKKKIKETEKINLDEFIDVKGWKSLGNRLTLNKVSSIKFISQELYEQDEGNMPASDMTEDELTEIQNVEAPEIFENENVADVEVRSESKENRPSESKKLESKAVFNPKTKGQSVNKSKSKPGGKKLEIGAQLEWDLD